MIARPETALEEYVDSLLTMAKIGHRHGAWSELPLTGARVENWDDDDEIGPIRAYAVAALRAREWFAAYGPKDAPLLPLAEYEIEAYRNARGLMGVVGFFARSLTCVRFDYLKHPSFEDFVRGLMAMAISSGLWGLEKDTSLIKRFPPKPLPGMIPGAYWEPPEEYERTMASYRRARSVARVS